MSNAVERETESKRNHKSLAAFLTISEVAGELNVPKNVLRFWESKFSQVKPLRGSGGRRYYRLEDVALLERIRSLRYNDGYTIKGVQKVLRDSSGRKGGASAALGDDGPTKVAVDAKTGTEAPIGALKWRELESIVRELEALQQLLARRTMCSAIPPA